MNSSNGNFLDENGNPVNIVQLLKTGKAVPVENPGPGLHMAAHSGWFTDESGKPVNIIALIDAAIDEDGGDDEPAIGGISINGGNVVTPDANGIINLTISGDGSTVIDSKLSASSTNPVQNKVVTGEINELSEAVDSLNGSLEEQANTIDRVEMDDIESLVYNGLTVTKCTVANGTVVNANNKNAVNTSNYIPCTTGDSITIYPVRPIPERHKYRFVYATYDENLVQVSHKDDSSAAYKTIKVTGATTRFIRFGIFEFDETNTYVPLRANTFYNAPIAITRSGNVREDLDDTNFALSITDKNVAKVVEGLSERTDATLTYFARCKLDSYGKLTYNANYYLYMLDVADLSKIVVTSCNSGSSSMCFVSFTTDTIAEIKSVEQVSDGSTIFTGPAHPVSIEIITESFLVPGGAVTALICSAQNYGKPSVVSYKFSSAGSKAEQADLDALSDTVDLSLSDAMKNPAGVSMIPVLANGTAVNPNNANAVCTKDYIPAVTGEVYNLNIVKPASTEGGCWQRTYATYDENKNILRNHSDGEPIKPIVIVQPEKYIRFAIFERDASGNTISRRITDFTDGDVLINKRFETSLYDSKISNLLSQARYSDTENAKILTLLHFSDVHDGIDGMNGALLIADAFPQR